MKLVIIFDMYGVIIKESKGNFIPYVYHYFPDTDIKILISNFTKAQTGEITGDEFITRLGFNDPDSIMRDYVKNHLTFDSEFIEFADKYKDNYDFILLSNDVSSWSEYLTFYHGINKYFIQKIISGDVGYRKPDSKIYELAISKRQTDYIFVDNSVKNLIAAQELGIRPILFNRDNETYNGEIVYSFSELERMIKL